MAMSDPFDTTYQGTMQAKESLGAGIASAAGSVADAMQKQKQQAQNKKMMDLFGIGQQTGLIDKQDPTNDQLAQGLQQYGKMKGINVEVNHGDNPDQAKSNMLGIYKALGIPVPQGTIKVNADTNMKSGMKATLEFDDKGNLRPKFTTVDPDTEALKEQTIELRKQEQSDREDKQKTTDDEYLDKEYGKIDKITNPDIATNRSPLGMAGRANMSANRALMTLNNPMVTNQEAGNVMADIAGIYQNGSPTEFGMSEQGYKTVYAQAQGALQYFTGNPQDAVKPEIKQRLKDVLNGMKKTNKSIIKENLNALEVSHRTAIQKDPERWSDYRKTIESMGDSGDSSNDASTITKMTGTSSGNVDYKSKYGLN